MDCTMVTSRVAAFIDGELAPGDCERFVLHIETCDPCTQIVIQLEAQRFVPLSADQRRSICGRGEFWGDMDSVLGTHLDQMVLAKTACLGPWHRRRVGMPLPMVLTYAAAILLAVSWGLQQRERAQLAELATEHLGQQLEQERRLAAQPSVTPTEPGTSTYKVVTYTPERGTF
jgi:hypothetical protein